MELLYYIIAVKIFHTIVLRVKMWPIGTTISHFPKKFVQVFIQPGQQNDNMCTIYKFSFECC